MWNLIGFKNSPYNAEPLKSSQDDADLLVARESEGIKLCTALESVDHGVLVLSGSPGVGKTSFLNVQQYLLESGKAYCGPKILAARQLCPIQPGDTSKTIALRAAHSLHRSIVEYCSINSIKLPKETRKIGKWINSSGGSGFEIGIQVLGCGGNIGRQVEVPSLSDISFEGLKDVISCLVSEVINVLNLKGAIIAFDNIENLEDTELANMLISFRDTLFSLPYIWWILIGQSGLASLIQTLDPRVSERLTGTGIELEPVSFEELHEAIKRRVDKFHSKGSGNAPLPESIHKHLYEASNGEIRFVFKYSNSICIRFVEDIRKMILGVKKDLDPKALDTALGNAMTAGIINDKQANPILRDIVTNEFKGINLKPKEKRVLHIIGQKHQARTKDYKEYGLKSSQDFSSNYLIKFHKAHLLIRQQEGKAVIYRLRGLASLAEEYGLLT